MAQLSSELSPKKIPLISGSDLKDFSSKPGLFDESKANYVLVVEFDLFKLDSLKESLKKINEGRTQEALVQIFIIVKGNKEHCEDTVLKQLRESGVADHIDFVLCDDGLSPSGSKGFISDFWTVYQGEKKGQKKAFWGLDYNYSTSANKIGMTWLDAQRGHFKEGASVSEYFHKKIHSIKDYKPHEKTLDPDRERKYVQSALPQPQVVENHKPSKDDMINPIAPESRSFSRWLISSYFPALSTIIQNGNDEIVNTNDFSSLPHFLRITFLKVFGLDGYNFLTNKITCADGETYPLKQGELSWALIIAAFVGLPSRPDTVIDGVPYFSGWQLIKNLFGGLNLFSDPSKKNRKRFEKRGWEIAALPVKICIILPLKLILIPFKLFANTLKFFTEFIPIVVNHFFLALLTLLYNIEFTIFESDYNKIVKGILFFLNTIAVVSVALIQYACVLLIRIAMAVMSPEKSARLAFALGRSVSIDWFGEGFGTVMSYVMGCLGAILSLSVSAVVWTILLPLTLGGLTTLFPSLISAMTWVSQLPLVAATASWFSSLVVVKGSMLLVNQFFASVASVLVNAFGPFVAAIATQLSIQIPAAVYVVGITFGMFLTPALAIVSRVADELSNFWAIWQWQEGGPLTWLSSCSCKASVEIELQEKVTPPSAKKSKPNTEFYAPLSDSDDEEHGSKARKSVKFGQQFQYAAYKASDRTDQVGDRAVTGDNFPNSQRREKSGGKDLFEPLKINTSQYG